MYIQDVFNPNQKKKLKGNKLVDNPKNLNSVGPVDSRPQNSTTEVTLLSVDLGILFRNKLRDHS